MTRAETVRCPKCHSPFTVQCDHETDVGFYGLADDETGICPTCGHSAGQPIPAWRKGWDFEQAEQIEAMANSKGVELTEETAAELWELLEARGVTAN